MPVVHIHSKEEFQAALKNANYVHTIVDFTATWCGPCHMIKPYFLEKSDKYRDVQFLSVDVDELETVAREANVQAMPTFHIYKKGKKVNEFVGSDRAKLESLAAKYSSLATGNGKKSGGGKKPHKCAIL